MKRVQVCVLASLSLVVSAPVFADFYDTFSSTDPNVSIWTASDGWNNGYPFDTCWKSKQFSRKNDIGTFVLVNSSECLQTTIGPEYWTNGFYGYGTYTFSMKAPSQSSGTVFGAFTYRGPQTNNNGNPMHNEIDIEFFKEGVQFYYFHNGIGGDGAGGGALFLTKQQLGFNPSKDFHTYAFSWQAGSIKFMVDSVVKQTVTKNIPTAAEGGMKIMVNLWKCLVSNWCGVAPATINTTGYVDWVKYTVK